MHQGECASSADRLRHLCGVKGDGSGQGGLVGAGKVGTGLCFGMLIICVEATSSSMPNG